MRSAIPRRKPQGICSALSSMLSDHPHPVSVEHVRELSVRMALAYLHQKRRRDSLSAEPFGLSMEELAIDSTADLFQRDDRGRYVQLRKYFDSVDWTKSDETDLAMALRRIVFGRVSESLFHRIGTNEPNPGKLVRDIEDAARSTSTAHLERLERRLWIVAGKDGRLEHGKPVMPPEIVESYVTPAAGGSTHEAVHALVLLLESNRHYRNGFPVLEFARVVRSASVRPRASRTETSDPRGSSGPEGARANDVTEAAP